MKVTDRLGGKAYSSLTSGRIVLYHLALMKYVFGYIFAHPLSMVSIFNLKIFQLTDATFFSRLSLNDVPGADLVTLRKRSLYLQVAITS